MSSYATEFEHTDDDGDFLHVNRCQLDHRPTMVYIGHAGVEMWREDVARLAEYLTSIVDTVPERTPTLDATAVTFESAGAIVDGVLIPYIPHCTNTIAAAMQAPNRAQRRKRK